MWEIFSKIGSDFEYLSLKLSKVRNWMMMVCRPFVLTLLFLVCASIPVLAQEEADVLEQCHQRIRQREEKLGLSEMDLRSLDDLKNCNFELGELYNPKLLDAEEVQLDQLSCAWTDVGCHMYSIAVDKYFFYAGLNGYTKRISEQLRDVEKQRLKSYTQLFPDVIREGSGKQGLEAILESSWWTHREKDEVTWEVYKPRSRLHYMMSDLAYHFIRSEMLSLGFFPFNQRDMRIVDNESNKLKRSMQICVRQIKQMAGLFGCVDIIKTYASFSLGESVVVQNLKNHFFEGLTAIEKKEMSLMADQGFQVCLTQHFFAEERTESSFLKMKACVYEALILSFKKALRFALVNSHPQGSRLSDQEIQALVQGSLESCHEERALFQQEKVTRYRFLQQMEADQFQVALKSCQIKVESSLVSQIVRATILAEPIVVQIYGDQIEDFVEDILSEDLLFCKKEIQSTPGASARNCSNYLFASVVKDVFEEIIDREVKKQLLGIGLQSEELQLAIVRESIAKSEICYQDVLSESLRNFSISREEMEKKILPCLSEGVLEMSKGLAVRLIDVEFGKNEFVEKYNVRLGENKLILMVEQFGQCLKDGLTSVVQIVDVEEALLRQKNICELLVYKEIVRYTLTQIMRSEMIGSGLRSDEIDRLIHEYENQPQSVYQQLQDVQNRQDLDDLLLGVDKKIIRDLARPLISQMVQVQAGAFLWDQAFERIVTIVSKEFLTCVEFHLIADCQRELMPLAIESILYNALPVEVEKELYRSAQQYLSKSALKSLELRRVVRRGIDTPSGRMLIDFIVEQVILGESLEAITAPGFKGSLFRKLLFQVLKQDQGFMEKLLEAIIQPQMDAERLNQEKKSPFHWFAVNIVMSKKVFYWKNIKETPSGQQVVSSFEDLFERLVISPNQPIRDAEMEQLARLVRKATAERSRGIQ